MKKYLGLFIVLIIVISCRTFSPVPKYLKEVGFNFRYEDKQTQLSEKLNVNGYFTLNDTLNSMPLRRGYMNTIFFSDGMFVTYFYEDNDTASSEIGKVIPSYINKVIDKRQKGERYFNFYESAHWGYYKVNGDTIKVQHINRPFMYSQYIRWDAFEIWFKIIDRNNIIEIYRKPINKLTEADLNGFYQYESKREKYKLYFLPLEEMPESDGWLKYEDWFWKAPVKYDKWLNTKKYKETK